MGKFQAHQRTLKQAVLLSRLSDRALPADLRLQSRAAACSTPQLRGIRFATMQYAAAVLVADTK